MTKPHLRFKNLHPATVGAAERLFAEKPWELTSTAQVEVGQDFLNDAAAAYKVAAPELAVSYWAGTSYRHANTQEDSLGHLTVIEPAKVVLGKFSIVGLFMGARTHLIAEGAADATDEDDEMAWAYSLYYRVKPRAFRRLAREGRLSGVTAEDTYTSESWQRLIDAGAADWNGRLTVSHLAARDILNEQWQPSDEEIAEIDTQDEPEEFPLFQAEPRDPQPDPLEVSEGQAAHDQVEQALVAGVDYEESVPANPDWENEDGSLNHDAIAAEFDDGLDALNRDQIRALAVANGVPRGDKNKTELIAALREMNVTA